MAELQFTLETKIETVDAAIQAKGNAVELALVRKVDYLDALLQRKIVDDKLSGQVLNAITGRLARSVEAIPATVSGNVIEGSVQAGGGVAFYGRFQEEGTRGPYEIVPRNAKFLAFRGKSGDTVFARKVTHPGLPPRPFVGSSFKEMHDQILAELQAVPGETK